MGTSPEEKQRVRLLLLNAAYDESDGGRPTMMHTDEIAAKLGLPPRQVWDAARYLADEGLLRILAGSGDALTFDLQHAGVVEVEETRSGTRRGTSHFPAPVVAWVTNNFSNSTVGVVQTGAASVAHLAQTQGVDATALQALLTDLLRTVPSDRPELRATVEDLQEEAAKPERRPSKLRAYLSQALALGKDLVALVALVKEVAKLVGVPLP